MHAASFFFLHDNHESCKKHFIFIPSEIFCLLCKLAEKFCTRQTSLDLPQFCSNSFKCVVSSVSQRQTGSVLGCRGNLVGNDGNVTLINAAFGLGLCFRFGLLLLSCNMTHIAIDKSAKHTVKSNRIGLGAHTAEARWCLSQESNQTLPLTKNTQQKPLKEQPNP